MSFIKNGIHSLVLIAIGCTLLAFQCDKKFIECESTTLIPAKYDSMSVMLINRDVVSVPDPNNFRLKNISISFIGQISPKDSTPIVNFCSVFDVKGTIQNFKIITNTKLNADYPIGSDITQLFRNVHHNFSIDQPYYTKIDEFIAHQNKIKQLPQQMNFLMVEPIEVAPNTSFSASIQMTYTEDGNPPKTVFLPTQTIQIL